VSSSAIARLVARGFLWPEHPGVYVAGFPGAIADLPGAAQASALLAVRPGACLSHGSAWRWWLADTPPRPAPSDAAQTIHVTLPGNRARGPEGVVVHRSTILVARDLRIRDGLPLTSPARVLLDLAGDPERSARELERDFDTALARRLITRRDVGELLRRCGRHPGRARLSALEESARSTTFTRSEAEERMLALVRAADLAAPLVNAPSHGYEIDFLWPQAGVAVEVDGYAFHSGRDAFERDRRRDQILLAAGIRVLRVTWRQLTDEPFAVTASLAAALAGPRDR
jgi:very-short-patch-repair endonuclease